MWLTGWSGSGFYLVGRLLVPFGIFTHVAKSRTGFPFVAWLGAADPSGFVNGWGPNVQPVGLDFPWTFNVFPD